MFDYLFILVGEARQGLAGRERRSRELPLCRRHDLGVPLHDSQAAEAEGQGGEGQERQGAQEEAAGPQDEVPGHRHQAAHRHHQVIAGECDRRRV